jgi:prevent-host-death family protein
MINMSSTEAKTNFGALLDMAQRNPVTIEKKGRPVAVIVSDSEYKVYQQLKLQVLQNDLNAGIHQADQGLLVHSDTAFNGLI